MSKKQNTEFDAVISMQLAALKANRHWLTKQQIKTLRGQILSGNGEGAMKGLHTIAKRKKEGAKK